MNNSRPAQHTAVACLGLILLLGSPAESRAQQKGPMTNASVISMVKGGTSESVILYVIKSNETNFNTTPAAIAELRKAEVSQKLIDAMTAAGSRAAGSVSPAAGESAARAGGVPAQRQPYALLMKEKGSQPVPSLLARITPAKVKREKLGSLASQGVVSRALEGTADLAVDEGLRKAGSSIGASLGSPVADAAKSVIGGLFSRKPTMTFVWSIPVQASLTSIPATRPVFEVFYKSVPHVNSNDFAPLIVKLIREKKDDWRLVCASEGEPGALESDEWEVCDDFSQEEISCTVKQTEDGAASIQPEESLDPGEYAVVLRPTSSGRTFSGPDIAGSKDEGRLFNAVWGFKIEKQK